MPKAVRLFYDIIESCYFRLESYVRVITLSLKMSEFIFIIVKRFNQLF